MALSQTVRWDQRRGDAGALARPRTGVPSAPSVRSHATYANRSDGDSVSVRLCPGIRTRVTCPVRGAEGLTGVATDSHRLASVSVTGAVWEAPLTVSSALRTSESRWI